MLFSVRVANLKKQFSLINLFFDFISTYFLRFLVESKSFVIFDESLNCEMPISPDTLQVILIGFADVVNVTNYTEL